MSWHSIRSFRSADYPAVMRVRDALTGTFRFHRTTTDKLTPQMRQRGAWYVAGWKLHISIYPAEYAAALPALRQFEEAFAPTGLVYKYAATKRLYESFDGPVKGKFATIYCKFPSDIPPTLDLLNRLFAEHRITPVNETIVDTLEGLRHELPMLGGYGFVRYGAFSYQRALLDLSDPQREPMPDDRRRPFPLFNDPGLLTGELATFRALIA